MPDDDQMIGQMLGNYQITQKLGQGGMGVVYQARHATLNRLVAIKFLASQCSKDKEYVDRFLREAQATARLNHPNIIGVYDAGVSDDVYYLVMEYVRGRDLACLLRLRKVFDEFKAIRLMRHAASALGYAHGEGIIHQDIKPENLILTPEDQIKLCDLGLATWVSDPVSAMAVAGEVIGTPFYISPEQVSDAASVDARTDIYSLGAAFFHILTGRPPFPGDDHEEVMTKHLREPLPWPRSIRPDLSEDISQILSKMMAKDVNDRMQSMDAVVAALTLLEAEHANAHSHIHTLTLESAGSQKTVSKLKGRLYGRTDFPSLAGTVNVISKLAAVNDATTIEDLTETILTDFALTNKILKLVNSAFYSAYDGKIGTVSRAVMVLGLAQVRNAALSLMLFENVQNRPLAREIKEISVTNFLSGIIARHLSKKVGFKNKEEAYICSLFHNLGKLLVTFYLPEENAQVKELMAREHLHEQLASGSALGISYEHLGIKIADEWNFPEQIIATMQRLPTFNVPKPKTAPDQLRCVVCFSNELAAILRDSTFTEEMRDTVFQELIQGYKNCFSISIDEIAEILDTSLKELTAYVAALNMTLEV